MACNILPSSPHGLLYLTSHRITLRSSVCAQLYTITEAPCERTRPSRERILTVRRESKGGGAERVPEEDAMQKGEADGGFQIEFRAENGRTGTLNACQCDRCHKEDDDNDSTRNKEDDDDDEMDIAFALSEVSAHEEAMLARKRAFRMSHYDAITEANRLLAIIDAIKMPGADPFDKRMLPEWERELQLVLNVYDDEEEEAHGKEVYRRAKQNTKEITAILVEKHKFHPALVDKVRNDLAYKDPYLYIMQEPEKMLAYCLNRFASLASDSAA